MIPERILQIPGGCAFCLDIHSKDGRAAGETEQRLYLLNACREAPFFSDRERAALAWTEAVTLDSVYHVPDAVYDEARAVLRKRAGEPHTRPRYNQRVESPVDCFPGGPGAYQPAHHS
jgi:hypothetical protein